MQVTKKELEDSQVELTIEVSVEEVKPFVDEAAKRIGKEVSIKGFRKGKVPYDVLAQHIGEATIYEEAFNAVVEATYPKAIDQEKLEIVGRADIQTEKVAPGNPIIYKAIVPLMPKITLGDYKTKLKTKKGKKEVDEKKFQKTIDDLRKMKASEKLVNREAKEGDRVMIDFDVKIDKVSIEGGQGQNQGLILGEGRFIPGFEENITGMKKGEEKTFQTSFPKNYHKKNLQGKKADVDIKVHEVYEITLPEVTDEWAKELNFDTADELKSELKKNLVRELEQESQQEFENKIIEEMVEISEIAPIPPQLIKEETHKMLAELKNDIMQQGMKFEDYINHIDKTEVELMGEFKGQAEMRIKAAMIMREVAIAEDITIDAKEIQKEIDEMKAMYEAMPEMTAQLDSPEHRARLENAKIHHKTFEALEGYAKGEKKKTEKKD